MPASDHRQLERVCRRRIAELDLPSPLQLAELKTRLETRRGRELWVLPDQGELPPEITGLWIGTATRDYVYYQHGLDGCLLETTLLHEFSHMLCNHRSANVQDQAWLHQRASALTSLGAIEHMCMRTDYGSSDEREAELMASLILARATRRWHRKRTEAMRPDELAARRVDSIFKT